MTNIDSIKYNNKDVTSISYNSVGNTVTSLVYNGEYIWKKDNGLDDPPTPPELSEDKDNFSYIYPICIDDVGNIYPELRYPQPINYPSNYTLRAIGNLTFPIIYNFQNNADIKVIYNYTDKNQCTPFVYKLDDRLLIGSFRSSTWLGGSSSGQTSKALFQLEVSEQGSTSLYLIQTLGGLDENNTEFISDLFTTKVIKIPSCGCKSYFYFIRLPYTFDPKFFEGDILMYQGNLDVYPRNPNNSKVKYLKLDSIDKTNSTYTGMFNELEYTKKMALWYKINYDIKPNTTSKFKLYILVIKEQENSAGTMVVFIQEPHNTNRIYYGLPGKTEHAENRNLYSKEYDDLYRNAYNEVYYYGEQSYNHGLAEGAATLYKYNSIFLCTSSTIVEDDYILNLDNEFKFKSSFDWTTLYTYICIPSTYSIECSTEYLNMYTKEVTKQFKWDNIDYDIYHMRGVQFKITKKVK